MLTFSDSDTLQFDPDSQNDFVEKRIRLDVGEGGGSIYIHDLPTMLFTMLEAF